MSDRPVLPPRLRRGDTIGLLCPAGPVRELERLQAGIRLLTDMGFAVKVQGAVEPREGYLADSDARRAENLHKLWSDDEAKAVLAIRGGYGCLRLVKHLDVELFRRHPKLLIGFSDVTVLLGLLAQAGIVSLHGPVVSSLARSDEDSKASLFTLLTGDIPERIKPKGLEILRGGTGRGRLIGGNLTTLAHLLGTPWDTAWDNCIVLLEDTGEALYRLDRMLTQLALVGRLERLAGLILGAFDCGVDDRLATLRLQEGVWSRIMELVGPKFPVWANFPIGHQERNLTLPIGMEAIMESGTLRLLPESVTIL